MLILLFVVVMIVTSTQRPSEVQDSSPQTSPTTKDSTRPPVTTVCALQQLIHSDPQDLYAALSQSLGADAIQDRIQQEGYWIGGAKFAGGTMEVYEKDGKLDQVNIFFDTPVHREDALAMFGFPTHTQPTKEGPLFFTWENAFGIERLHFARVRGGDNIERAMVEP